MSVCLNRYFCEERVSRVSLDEYQRGSLFEPATITLIETRRDYRLREDERVLRR